MMVKIAKYMARFFGFLLITVMIFSCKNEPKLNPRIDKIIINLKVERFDQKFYSASKFELSELKSEFPYMFPTTINDSVWIEKMGNEQEQFLFSQSEKEFNDFTEVENELIRLFQIKKQYHPKFNEPTVITHISDLDYDYPIIYADSLLFIALDMFLGKDNEVYSSFPQYISQNYNKENLIVAVANEINHSFYPILKSRSFLDKIINQGKFLHALDIDLPEVESYLKIGYTNEKMNWAAQNESNIWKYFIENEMLYSSDESLNSRFIELAPFSKFYQQSDGDSPGRIGIWIGWQIVNSYMKNNDVTLQKLMIMKPEEIFRNSKYKPRK